MHTSQTSNFKPSMPPNGDHGVNAKTPVSLAGKTITPRNTLTLWMLLGLLIVAWTSGLNIAQAEVEYRFERKWPQLEQPWYFNGVTNIAVALDGSVFVADAGNNRIQHLQANGRVIATLGRFGSGPGEFNNPQGVAVAPNGSVFVADRDNDRIQHFTADGNFIAEFGTHGETEEGGLFYSPSGLAMTSDGLLLVADTNNHRIQKFSLDGTFISQWGSKGDGDGQFDRPYNVAVAPDGMIWVVDSGNDRLQAFDTEGNYVKTIIGPCSGKKPPDCYSTPLGLAFNADGDLWMTNYGSLIFLIDTETGKIIRSVGSYGAGKGEFHNASGLATAPDGSVWVSDGYRIEILDAEGLFLRELTSTGLDQGSLASPMSITIKPDDSIWVVDGGEQGRVQVFDTEGHFVKAIGPWGWPDGIIYPTNMAIAPTSTIYTVEASYGFLSVIDANGQMQRKVDGRYLRIGNQFIDGTRILSAPVIDDNGVFIREDFIVDGQEPAIVVDGTHVKLIDHGKLVRPLGVAIGRDNTVYVTDTANHRVQVFNADGTRKLDNNGNPVISFGKDVRFNFPKGITVDADGRIWVVDIIDPSHLASNAPLRLRIFDTAGNLLKSVDNLGPCCAYGHYPDNFPNSLSLAPNGHVWMADSGSGGVQEFDTEGNFVRRWGSAGFTESQFSAPAGVAVDSKGKVYVADALFNRIQVFNPVDNPDHSKAIIVAAGGTDNNELWTATTLNASFAYRTFRSQGYNKDEIQYLSNDTQQDLDLNGQLDDIAGLPTKTMLEAAIKTWTTQSDTDNLVVYLVDHGGDGTFRLNDTETLTAAELNAWLSDLEKTKTDAGQTLQHITLIIDACESGSFLPILKGPNRRIIASAQAQQNAYFLTQGTVSFSNYFWTHLFHGNDLRSAFDHASDVMAAYQTPQVDFNGNGVANEDDDLARLNNQFIGNGIGAQSSAPDLSLAQAAPAVLPAAGGTAVISANITDGDGILDAYAIVRPPDFNPGAANNTIINLPKIPLSYNSQTDRYESNGYWDTNAQGQFSFNSAGYPFARPGTYVLTLYAEDNNYNAAEPKQLTLSVATGKHRRAVIVEGYGAGSALTASFKDNAKLAHDALIHQGYREDDIYYLSGAGLPGVDATPTAANVQFALTQWGISKGMDSTEDLTVYLIADRAQINQQPGLLLAGINNGNAFESVTLSQLKQWLDARQSGAGFNQSTGLPYSGLITVIVDACYSGDILTVLNPEGKRRILISSTTAEGAAHFTNHTLLSGQAFSTELSFSRVFWQKVEHGANLRDAFSAAGNAVNLVAGVQTPQLDDNFNGLGNDDGDATTTPPLAKDGDLARKWGLGYGILAAEDQPRIVDHTPSGDVQSDHVRLTMDIAGTSPISAAWAIITRPDYSPDCSAYDQLPKLHLTQDAKHSGHWSANYSKFNVNGDYNITFYAIDQNAQQSQPATAVLQRTTAAEFTEGGPDTGLLEPNNSLNEANFSIVNDRPKILALETANDQDWLSFYAQRGETYTVETKKVGTGIDLGLQLYNAQGQQLKPSIPNSVIDAGQRGEPEIFDWQAPKDGFYFVKVSNRGHSTGPSNRYQLQIYVAHAPEIGLIKGVITDACDRGTLGGVQVKVPGTGYQTVSHSTGVYGLPLRAETAGHTYPFAVNATGYQAQSFARTLLPNKIIAADINLKSVAGCTAPAFTTALPANSVVNGGSFNTPLQGVPGAPALLLNADIGGNAILSHVTIGDGTVLDAKTTLKPGVRFTDNRLIPAGIDLTRALDSLPSNTPGTPTTINLHQDVINPPGENTLLQQLQDLKAFKTRPVTQDDHGLLQFQVGAKLYAVRPVQVTQAAPGTPPGIRYSDQGLLQMMTTTGRIVSFIGSINDRPELEQDLAALNLNLGSTDAGNGNIVIYPGVPTGQPLLTHWVARPALYSEPAWGSRQPGVYRLPHAKLRGISLFSRVFEQAGERRQQALYPMPQDWEALKGYLQQQGYQNIRLNPDGILQFEHKQQRRRGLMDYAVNTGDQGTDLHFEAAGDLNKDGQDDIAVTYPDGGRQGLFMLPER